MSTNDPKVIIALDFNDAISTMNLVYQLDPSQCKLKIGKELFTAEGPDLVNKIVSLGFDVFLDLKFHDIPTTVRKAVTAAANLGVWMLNVHALGGAEMITQAREGLMQCRLEKKPYLIAVTVLTSTNQAMIEQLGFNVSVETLVKNLAQTALDAGADGLVCSAQEASALRSLIGDKALLVTPGIRPEGSNSDDQQRIMTPKLAMDSGSSYLVVGRPITQSDNPVKSLEAINRSLL